MRKMPAGCNQTSNRASAEVYQHSATGGKGKSCKDHEPLASRQGGV